MYYPRRPVKSFQDLEVYQKLLAICVEIVKRIAPKHLEGGDTSDGGRLTPPSGGSHDSSEVDKLINQLHQAVLSLPVLIATAHSLRFSNPAQSLAKLEEAMLNCNLAVVYLEQFRDLAKHEIETEFFEEQVKGLLTARMKIMHLQRSWKRFMEKNTSP